MKIRQLMAAVAVSSLSTMSLTQAAPPGELFPGAGSTRPVDSRPRGGNAAVDVPPPVSRVEVAPALPEPVVSATAPKKLPVPDATALASANKLINEIFSVEIANAKTAAQKSAIVAKLMGFVREEKDPATKFALLTRAREVAIDAVDLRAMSQSIDSLEALFDVDAGKLEAESLGIAVKGAGLPAQRTAVTDRLRALINEAIAADHFEDARPLVEIGVTAARAWADGALVKEFLATAQSIKDAEATFGDVKKALDVLATTPNDPAANLKVGMYRCFIKEDWKKGLGNLVLGSDKALAAVAQLDWVSPTDPDEQMKAGDGWWEYSTSAAANVKAPALRRACAYYNKAVGGLTGLSKAKVEKRLAEVGAPAPTTSGAPTGQSTPLMKGSGTEYVTSLLSMLPPEMLPANGDTKEQVTVKSANANKFLAGKRPYRQTVFIGNAMSAAAGLIQLPGQNVEYQGIQMQFTQHMEYNGVHVNAFLMTHKKITNLNDPALAVMNDVKKTAGRDEEKFKVATTITGVRVNYFERDGKVSISLEMEATFTDYTVQHLDKQTAG